MVSRYLSEAHSPFTWGGAHPCAERQDACLPPTLRPDETRIRALARAYRWKRMLEEGRYGSAGEIANAEKVTQSFVNRLLRLTLLAPDIQEAIDGSRRGAAGGVDMGDAERVARTAKAGEFRGPYNEKAMTSSADLSTVRLGDPLGDGLGGRRLLDRSNSRRAAREDR